jgi:hypothetical protein
MAGAAAALHPAIAGADASHVPQSGARPPDYTPMTAFGAIGWRSILRVIVAAVNLARPYAGPGDLDDLPAKTTNEVEQIIEKSARDVLRRVPAAGGATGATMFWFNIPVTFGNCPRPPDTSGLRVTLTPPDV